MSVDITFTPEESGFFGAPTGAGTGTLLQKSTMEKYAGPMAMGAIALQGITSTMASKSYLDNIFANVDRMGANVEQMASALDDTLEIQARKVSRRAGEVKARIGASGLGMSGSPLLVMADTYARGMEDYDAISQEGKYAIENAYTQIYDELDRAKDVGTQMMVGGLQTAATGAFTGSKLGMFK